MASSADRMSDADVALLKPTSRGWEWQYEHNIEILRDIAPEPQVLATT